jgi:hypothetical protein
MVAGSVPLLSSSSLALVANSHTLIRVPWTDAVAILVASWLNATQAISPLWALIQTGAQDTSLSVHPRS